MNNVDLQEFGKSFRENFEHPTLLFSVGDHRIYWLGIPEHTAFRANTYLVTDYDEAVIIDPGGAGHFEFVRNRVAQILSPERVTAQVLSHQDPDVAASFPFWADVNPAIKVIATYRTHTLLSHYRDFPYESVNIHDHPEYRLTSGATLQFFPAPFLHSPSAMVTYDPISGFLFSGDIWAAVDMEWNLVVPDFQQHRLKMNLYHLEYMASHIAAMGFVNRIRHLKIEAILPQHGSIIPSASVPQAMEYLNKLNCGTDIIYPDLK